MKEYLCIVVSKNWLLRACSLLALLFLATNTAFASLGEQLLNCAQKHNGDDWSFDNSAISSLAKKNFYQSLTPVPFFRTRNDLSVGENARSDIGVRGQIPEPISLIKNLRAIQATENFETKQNNLYKDTLADQLVALYFEFSSLAEHLQDLERLKDHTSEVVKVNIVRVEQGTDNLRQAYRIMEFNSRLTEVIERHKNLAQMFQNCTNINADALSFLNNLDTITPIKSPLLEQKISTCQSERDSRLLQNSITNQWLKPNIFYSYQYGIPGNNRSSFQEWQLGIELRFNFGASVKVPGVLPCELSLILDQRQSERGSGFAQSRKENLRLLLEIQTKLSQLIQAQVQNYIQGLTSSQDLIAFFDETLRLMRDNSSLVSSLRGDK